VQKEHQPNAIYFKMIGNEIWAKYFATCNTTESFNELIKIAVLLQRYHYANVERFFPWCSNKPKRTRNHSN